MSLPSLFSKKETRKPVITVSGLTAKYNKKTILDNVSLEIFRGEITVILGTSGCGKTTLLKNMIRLYEPSRGSVKIFNQEVTTLEEAEYASLLKRIGMLFQNGALLNSISVYDNVAIPLEQHTKLPKKIIDKMVRVKLQWVGLEDSMHLQPSELSGGMRKRAALARSMTLDPDILFFDEPSAGLDPVTSEKLDELIISLKNKLGITLVIVTHEPASINRIADRIIFLENGKITFTGSIAEAKKSGVSGVLRFFQAAGTM